MRIKRIDSPANSIYKDLALLVTKKGIHKQRRTLVSGEKIVRELLPELSPESFFIFHSEHHDLFDAAEDRQVLVLRKDLYEELDVVGTGAPLVCTEIPEISAWNHASAPQQNELLCALGDPTNLGAVIRSACAFGIRKIVLLEECAHPYLPKVTKAASGCNFLVTFERGPSIKNLQNLQNLVALDMNGTPLRTYVNSNKGSALRWLIGEEGLGIPHELACDKVSIPMSAEVESLNAAVSASILLYEIHSLEHNT